MKHRSETIETPNGRIEIATVEMDGREFTALGAVVTEDSATGYINGSDLTDWESKRIGSVRVVSSWPMPRSWQGSRMYQIEATINGIVYTGRGFGNGMLWRGKRKRTKR